MRIWDMPVENLCNRHFLGQHREIHAIYGMLTKIKDRANFGPEVNRWRGHLTALWDVHEKMVLEMQKRNFNHKSVLGNPIDGRNCLIIDKESDIYPNQWQSTEIQIERIKAKNCLCKI